MILFGLTRELLSISCMIGEAQLRHGGVGSAGWVTPSYPVFLIATFPYRCVL